MARPRTSSPCMALKPEGLVPEVRSTGIRNMVALHPRLVLLAVRSPGRLARVARSMVVRSTARPNAHVLLRTPRGSDSILLSGLDPRVKRSLMICTERHYPPVSICPRKLSFE